MAAPHLRLDTHSVASTSSNSPSTFPHPFGQHLSGFATPNADDETDRPTYLSPARLYLAANARFAKPQSTATGRRQTSASSSTSPPSSSSPTTTVFSTHELRPWDRSSDLPSPLPSPVSLAPGSEPIQRLQSDTRLRTGSIGETRLRAGSIGDECGGAVSPALSTGSKTDAFFATSYKATLPTPPRPLHEKDVSNAIGMASLGKGLPSSTPTTSPDRAVSNPSTRSNAFFSTSSSDPVLPPSVQAAGDGDSPVGRTVHANLRKSPLRSFTAPHPPAGEQIISPRPQAVSRLVSGNHGLPPSMVSSGSFSSIASNPTPPPNSSRLPTPNINAAASSSAHTAPSRLPMKREATEKSFGNETASPTLHEGDVIGDAETDDGRRWKLGHVLGEGAFSVVWSGRELLTANGKEKAFGQGNAAGVVAIKMMDKTMCKENDRTRISFVREVEVLRHISHPSVVPFLASFSTATHHCLVLEHLGGGELFDLVSQPANRARMLLPCKDNQDTEGEALIRRIFGELCHAVGWLHAVGVVHRDIKLENLMLTTNPFALHSTTSGAVPISRMPPSLVKLTDFGLSRFISTSAPMLSTRCGSESYAAPEIIMAKQYDGRDTDSWAVGVVLYALIAGELPFDEGAAGTTASPVQNGSSIMSEKEERRRRMMRIAKGEYQWRDGVGSEGVRATVARLLVREPKRRTRVGPALWDEAWMHGSGEVVRPRAYRGMETEQSGRRRVLDSFLVDSEGIDEVARAETG